MNSREAFAQVLREQRLKKQYTQEELGELSGLSMRFISELERNVSQATISTVDALASALGITKVELMQEVEKLEKQHNQ